MSKNINFKFFKKGNHNIYQNSYHIVFATKYRKKIIGPVLKREIHQLYSDISAQRPDKIELVGVGIESDHVHVLVSVPPSVAVSKIVQKLKGYPSRLIFKKYPFLEKKIGRRNLWQIGYFCRSLGDANLPQIFSYLNKQKFSDYLGLNVK
ncbi:MAG: hypothetical protein A2145_02765 [candidate division Zixibacteria bacterium RBG_16_40_9]|nr:MAG: hypothetical protein A2145_02765 [candidate division Zixibacteria bacterium RBG_16_40_9]